MKKNLLLYKKYSDFLNMMLLKEKFIFPDPEIMHTQETQMNSMNFQEN
jgi:hypothetical protein